MKRKSIGMMVVALLLALAAGAQHGLEMVLFEPAPLYPPQPGLFSWDKTGNTFIYNPVPTGGQRSVIDRYIDINGGTLLDGNEFVSTWLVPPDGLITVPTTGSGYDGWYALENLDQSVPADFVSFDGTDDYLDLTSLLPATRNNVTIELELAADDTVGMLFGNSASTGRYLWLSAGSTQPALMLSGSGVVTVDGASVVTRDDLYQAMSDAESHVVNVTGADLSSYAGLLFNVFNENVAFLKSDIYSIKIDWDSSDTWDHILIPSTTTLGAMYDTVSGNTFTNAGTGDLGGFYSQRAFADADMTPLTDIDVSPMGAAGTEFRMRIGGTFPRIYFNNGGDKAYITTVENLGYVGWTSFSRAFWGTALTSINSGDSNTSLATDFYTFAFGCSSLTSAQLDNLINSNATTINLSLGSTAITSLDVSTWDISSIANAEQFLLNVTLNTTGSGGYDEMLNSFWAEFQAGRAQTNVSFHGGNSEYSFDGYYAHEGLTETVANGGAGWTIVDGGLNETVYAAEDYLNLGDEKVVNGGFDTDTVWVKGTGWTITNGVAIHAPGVGSGIYQIGGTPGKVYLLSFDISGRTAGSITPFIGGTSATSISSNGSKQMILVHGGGNGRMPDLFTDASFDGSIDNVSVHEILAGPYAGIDFSSVTNTAGYDAALNALITIDYPTNLVVDVGSVKYSYAGYYAMVELEAAGVTFTDGGLDTTVYAAEDYLNLGDELVVNGGFDPTVTEWSVVGESTVTGGVARIYSGAGALSYITQSPVCTIGKKYLTNYDVTDSTSGGIKIATFTETASSIPSTVGNHDVVGTSVAAGMVISRITTCDITIDNVSVREILPGPYSP